MNVLETLKALGPSIIRTITSWIIGWVVTLLGLPGPPTYQAPAAPTPGDPPPGAPEYEATGDAVDEAGNPIPEGTPVEVVPTGEPPAGE